MVHSVILGNGIVALSTAFRLAQQAKTEDRITIIGRPAREGSATLAAAAMLNSFAEIEAGGLESEIDLYRFELSHQATRMWPKFEEDIIRAGGSNLPSKCAACQVFTGGCYDRGTYIVNNTAADDLDDENYDAIVEALVAFNEQHEHVSPRDIPNYKPEQRYRATRAVYIPNEGWLNPRIVIEKLDKVLGLYPQVEFINDHVAKLKAAQGKVTGAELSDGRVIEGDAYLLATGASVSDILDASDIGVPMQRVFYGVGTSLEIKSPDHPHQKCVRTPNRGLACGIYSVPYFQGPGVPNDHILIGASNFISPWPYPYGRLTSVEGLTRAAMAELNANFYRADLVRVNVGWRPTSQDTYPLIGRTSLKNLVIATGTKRDGFHLAPLLSEQMAALMLGQKVDERLEVFAPERKPLRTLTREQAVEKAARHQISAAYQHGYSPSRSRMPEAVIQMHRDALEKLHDQVGAKDWGIPPEMLDMYRYGHAKA
ncbi:MAG: NAD(P)/FAD-dependent oxidoreductase [Hyphomonadaceae bacterium]